MNILPLRVALAQVNMTVGDIEGNKQRILAAMQQASQAGAHIVCLPELALAGYPPEDLLLKPGFVDANLRALQEIIEASRAFAGLTSVIGFVDREHDIYNAATIVHEGKWYGTYHKHYLPNYGVFDENRYFQAGRKAPLFLINGVHVGVNICEDVLKTLVYELSRYRNSLSEPPVIPPSVIEKPPSAELRPGQKDTDSLPPYDILDPILRAYAEEDRSLDEMLAMGFERKTVERVMRLVDSSEYKRRQAPPGVKITTRAFGRDRRLPITNHYRGLV